MNNLQALAPSGWTPAKFQPVATYFPAMDFAIYLKEDCSYREDRIDRGLTLLWHPYEERAVGVRLKGFRAYYEFLRAHVKDLDKKLSFVSMVAALELSMRTGDGEAIMVDAEAKRRREAYQRARELLLEVTLPSREVEMAEAA